MMDARYPLSLASKAVSNATTVLPLLPTSPCNNRFMPSGVEVAANLAEDAFLGVGQFKRETVVVKRVERVADL